MEAKQITTFNLNGKGIKETKAIKVTFEKDEARHLESGVINIHPDIEYQTIEGFGSAITDTVGYLYSKLSEENKKLFLEEYFGKDGLNYRFIRMHIDSCDYSLEEYQAVENPLEDPELLTFSINRDKKYMIPMLKDAMAVSKTPYSVLLSPWSPPKQWKTPPEKPKNDASVYGGNDLLSSMTPKIDYDNPSRCNGGKLKKEYYLSWAKYLAKYVKAYLAEGIPVTMMTLQNETIAATNWDSCVWTAEEQKEFLKDYIYPVFKEENLADKIGIYFWDHNKERVVEFAKAIIDDETINMIAGIAFHWYSGDHFEALSLVKDLYPNLKLMSSECCALHPPGTTNMFAAMLGLGGSVAEADYEDAAAYGHDIIGNINNGMHRWIDWNLCVDKNGGPRHVSSGFGAPVCVDEESGTFRNLLTFDYIEHFSKYILPDAKRIGFSRADDKVEITAAKNKDGTIVVVALNKNHQDLQYAIRMDGKIIRIEIPANSINTFII